MTDNHPWSRIVVATDGIWRAEHLAACIRSVDAIVSRLSTAAMFADFLKESEHIITNLRLHGLLDRGTPSQWGKSEGGTEGLSRHGYFRFTKELQRYGIVVKEEEISWSLQFEFEDMLEVVPSVNRLEIESVQMASPGFISFVASGVQGTRSFMDGVIHIFNSLFYYHEMKSIMNSAKILAEAEADAAISSARMNRGRVIEMEINLADKIAKKPSLREEHNTAVCSTEYERRLDNLTVDLHNGGCVPRQVSRSIILPTEEDLAGLAKLKCQGLIRGIGVDTFDGSENREKP